MPMVIPTTPTELEEMLGDSTRMQEVFKDKEAFKDLIKNYATAISKADDGAIAMQIREQVAEALKEQGVKRLPPLTAGKAPTSAVALGSELDGRFTGMGDFARTIWHQTIRDNGRDERLKIKNDLSSLVGADGGFLIPEVLRAELLRLSLESGIVRQRARVIPMDSLTVPFPIIDDISHATSVYGGMVGYWTQEAAALTESQPGFGRVLLEAKKLTLYTEVPNELIADSIASLEAFLNTAGPEAIAYFEDVAFLTGTGAGEPLGIVNAPVLVSVAKETGQTAATIVWQNLVKAYARLLPSAHANACWIANINTFPQLATMALNVGTGGSAIWLNNGQVGPPMTILGHPVIFTEKVPTLGTVGDIMLCACSYYLIGDRMVITASSSPHFKFQNDQTVYRFIERVDGRPWLQTALTPRNGTTTLSPFVAVATRA